MDIELILSHKVQIPIGARRTEPYVFPWKECLDPVWSSSIPAGAGPPRRCGGGGHVSLTGSRSNSWVGTPAPATRGHGHQHRSVDTLSTIYAIYAADIYTVSRVITAPIASTIAINMTSIRIDCAQMMFAILTCHGATLPAPVVVAECCKLRCRLMMLVHIFLTIPCPYSSHSKTQCSKQMQSIVFNHFLFHVCPQ